MQNVFDVIITRSSSELTVKCTGYSYFCMFGKLVASKPRAVVTAEKLQNNGGIRIKPSAFWTLDTAFMDAKRTCSACPKNIGRPVRVIRTR